MNSKKKNNIVDPFINGVNEVNYTYKFNPQSRTQSEIQIYSVADKLVKKYFRQVCHKACLDKCHSLVDNT